jgi:hypothetical protein
MGTKRNTDAYFDMVDLKKTGISSESFETIAAFAFKNRTLTFVLPVTNLTVNGTLTRVKYARVMKSSLSRCMTSTFILSFVSRIMTYGTLSLAGELAWCQIQSLFVKKL